jgi:hypothetical protein
MNTVTRYVVLVSQAPILLCVCLKWLKGIKARQIAPLTQPLTTLTMTEIFRSKLEEPLLNVAKAKYALLTAKLKQNDQSSSSADDTSEILIHNPPSTSGAVALNDNDHLFIEDAINELLKARRILRASYVYGFYLDASFSLKKFIFELIQTEFEECTENLSQIIARPNLKTPKHRIIKRTKLLKRKRIEFLDTIVKGLVLPETPPTLKRYSKQRWKYALKDDIELNDDYRNLIGFSIKELNPKDNWVIDKNGRHTNLYSILEDSPDLENQLESILSPSVDQGSCVRSACSRPKALNSLTGSLFNYCSIKCLKIDNQNFQETFRRLSSRRRKNAVEQSSSFESDKASANSSFLHDLNDMKFENDLQHAIEISKMQNSKVNSTDACESLLLKNDECLDNDLQLAIELSLVITKKPYTALPYNPIFLTNDNDLSTLIRNMDEVLYDGEHTQNNQNYDQQKTNQSRFFNENGKLSNFEIKSHRFEEELIIPNFLNNKSLSEIVSPPSMTSNVESQIN